MKQKILVAVLAFFSVFIGTPASAQNQGPSFPCARATTASEKAICASAALSRLDREIAAAYRRARGFYRADAAAGDALRQMQRGFNFTRDYVAEGMGPEDETLPGLMTRQRALLAEMAPLRAGWFGRWATGVGTAQITPLRGGRVQVQVIANEPVAGRWTCDVAGEALVQAGRLVLTEADLDGWRITITRVGGVLRLEETSPPGMDPPMRPYCGMNGGLAGDYLPLKPAQ